jgi:hypothetical protein
MAIKLSKLRDNTKNGSKIDEISQTIIVGGEDFNAGITILGRVSVFNDPSYYPPNFDIIVFNHTDEPISFTNKGYGLEVFWGDGDAKVWRKIELSLSLVDYNTPVTLEPHTEKWVGDNMWILNGSDINA